MLPTGVVGVGVVGWVVAGAEVVVDGAVPGVMWSSTIEYGGMETSAAAELITVTDVAGAFDSASFGSATPLKIMVVPSSEVPMALSAVMDATPLPVILIAGRFDEPVLLMAKIESVPSGFWPVCTDMVAAES